MMPLSPFIARTRAARRGLALVVALLASAGLAQDVITSEYHWHYEPGADAVPPAWARFPAIKYPARLLADPEPHYVVVLQHVDVRGERSTRAMFGDTGAVREEIIRAGPLSRLKGPATRDGQPVESELWFAVIFNPAAPAASRGDTPVRLLQVSPVPIPFERGKQRLPRARVRLAVSPDARVEIIAIEGKEITAEQRRAVEDTVAQWKFFPARLAGRAVFGEVTLPLTFLPMESAADRDYQPPRRIRTVRPQFSWWTLPARRPGEVRVQFAVDERGDVQEAAIVSSTSHGLDDAVLAAVRQWKYQPALRHGRPVRTVAMVPFRFGRGRGGEDTGFIDEDENGAAGAAPVRFDVAPRLLGALDIIYPADLALAGASGRARVVITVGTDGRVHDSRIDRATQPEFGRALQAALDAATFAPATQGTDQHPVEAVLTITRDFDPAAPSGSAAIRLAAADRVLLEAAKLPTATVADADRVTLTATGVPVLRALQKTPGWAEVEFWIDRSGAVRLPRIDRQSSELAGYAAVEEVSRRHFAPRPEPTRGRARVEFPATPAK